MKVNAHTISLAVSGAAIGVRASHLLARGNIRSANQIAWEALKVFGIGLSVYMTSYIGINISSWGLTIYFQDKAEDYLSQHGLLTLDNKNALSTGNRQFAQPIAEALKMLSDEKILTDDTRKALLVQNGQNALYIAEAIIDMHQNGFLNADVLIALQVDGGKYARTISDMVKILHHGWLAGNENRFSNILTAMLDLDKIKLLNLETLRALQTGDGEYSLEICEGIIGLAEEELSGRKDLMDALLTANGKYAVEIMSAFKSLKDDGILEKKHIEFSFIDEKLKDDQFTITENNSFVLNENPSEGTFVFFIEKHPDGTFEFLCS